MKHFIISLVLSISILGLGACGGANEVKEVPQPIVLGPDPESNFIPTPSPIPSPTPSPTPADPNAALDPPTYTQPSLTPPTGGLSVTGLTSGQLQPGTVTIKGGEMPLVVTGLGTGKDSDADGISDSQDMFPNCHTDKILKNGFKYGDPPGNTNSTYCGIIGDVEITWNNDIYYFSPFKNVTKIKGDLIIENYVITDLSFLENLTTVTGNVKIAVADKLESLTGLEKLTSIGGNLHIESNDHAKFVNLDGIKNLTKIGGQLIIKFNSSLKTIDALKNLTSVGASIKDTITADENIITIFTNENLVVDENMETALSNALAIPDSKYLYISNNKN